MSNVIDMTAHARLLLNRGRGPDGTLLSEPMFDVLTTPFVEVPDAAGTSYGYGLDIGEDERGPWIGHSGGMVGYTAFTAVEPETGLGIVILQNGSGSKEGVVNNALDAVRACIADAPLPDVWAPPEPTAIPDADRFVGEYADPEGGDALQVRADADGLRVTLGGASGRLERDPLTADAGDLFLVVHPELERFPIRFQRGSDGRACEAFYGDRWFRTERYDGEQPDRAATGVAGLSRPLPQRRPLDADLARRAAEGAAGAAVPRGAERRSGEAELQPLEDGWFSAGEPWVPRRIRFDHPVDGRTVLAEFNAGRWYRSFEE